MARALPAHHRQDGAGDVHRADERRRELALHLLRRQLLEEAGVEVAGVVDEDVDASEALDCGLDRGLGVGVAGDVELDREQVVGLADGLRHRIGVAPGRDDGIAGRQGGLGDVDAHAAPGTGDEPDLLVGHRDLSLMGWLVVCPVRAIQPPVIPVRKARVIGVSLMPPYRRTQGRTVGVT